MFTSLFEETYVYRMHVYLFQCLDKCMNFLHINRIRAHVAVAGLATVTCLRKKKMKVVMKKRQRFGFMI